MNGDIAACGLFCGACPQKSKGKRPECVRVWPGPGKTHETNNIR